jgi:AbrB family looped-hinge helix DNA binding protein
MEEEITVMGEKGQVVIPKEVRDRLKLQPKTKFLVLGYNDTVILKKLELPDLRKEWEEIFKIMDKKKLGLTEEDVKKEIETYRREKRTRKDL